jgi:uncharacterized tellurite resistance protein B-like protein
MAFWDIFKSNSNTDESSNLGRLHQKIQELLPETEEQKHILVACSAGLLARVAYTDMEIHENEVKDIKSSLEQWTDLSTDEAAAVTSLAISEIKDLAGLENHKYCRPLNDILSTEQKYGFLKSLFAIAASDGNVDNNEAEEIRVIATGLLLEHKHFVSAKATILDKLGALKSE